jgi:N-acetylneuraminic acid mutarotase
MKKLFTLLSLSLLFSLTKADYWTQKADFGGTARVGAVGFSIANKGYCGLGCRVNPITAFYTDFWEYDPSTNIWTQKADFIGVPRRGGASFSVGLKGYVGMGFNDTIPSSFSDFYEFDPVLNSWTQKQNYPGMGILGCTGFAAGGFGFMCMGQVSPQSFSDVWQYDVLLNSWTQKSDYAGLFRYGASAFVIDSFAYVGIGGTDVAINEDFWKYNVSNDSWTQIADFGGGFRLAAAGFSLLQFGYLGTGVSNTFVNSKDFWQYDPSLNAWNQKADFGGIERFEGMGFSIGNKGYLGTGAQYINNTMNFFNDFWEYTPDSTTGIEDASTPLGMTFTISPNPATQYAVISWQSPENKKIEITISDVNGKKIFSAQSEIKNPTRSAFIGKSEIKIDISQFSKGIYFVEASDSKQKAVKKFLKE